VIENVQKTTDAIYKQRLTENHFLLPLSALFVLFPWFSVHSAISVSVAIEKLFISPIERLKNSRRRTEWNTLAYLTFSFILSVTWQHTFCFAPTDCFSTKLRSQAATSDNLGEETPNVALSITNLIEKPPCRGYFCLTACNLET
jgi:hypothetical protein